LATRADCPARHALWERDVQNNEPEEQARPGAEQDAALGVPKQLAFEDERGREEGRGETDAGQASAPQHGGPGGATREAGPSELDHEHGGESDTDRFAEHEAERSAT
jgi:hypothetical protein